MKIGIFGGTFHPIHNGHMAVCQAAYEQLHLDKVYFLVAGNPPHKEVSGGVSRLSRYKMTEAALLPYDYFEALELEIFSNETSYSYLTLERLKASHPEDSLFFIMGEDSFWSFEDWVNPSRIMACADLVVAVRSKANDPSAYLKENHGGISHNTGSLQDKKEEYQKKFGGDYYFLEMDEYTISSQHIREKFREMAKQEAHDVSRSSFSELIECNMFFKTHIPEGALHYIENHRLYDFRIETDPSKEKDLRKEIQADLKKRLSDKRYHHTLGVAHTAAALAMNYDYPVSIAYFSGLLHDCAKSLNAKELLDYCKKNQLPISPAEEESPGLLHAKAGAHMARELFGISDREILHAIEVHTTGVPGMGLLDQILFVADSIEAERETFGDLEDARALAFQDLDVCCGFLCSRTLNYLKENGKAIDPMTQNTFEYYQKITLRKEVP